MTTSLYINDILIDGSPNINLTFSLLYSELTNPTTLKNSFSKTLNIEGTANNDKAFEQYFDWRHRVNNVSAARRIPFRIFIDNDLFTEGYCKLEKIERKGDWHQYSVTLYGGLGEFLYTLSDKKLSDLQWGGTNGLKHVVNKEFIKECWERDWNSPISPNSMEVHDSLCYVPMYNGLYDDFENDKLQVNNHVDDENAVELPQEMDEWGMKSFRSYKQRPAVRVASVIEEILDNSGYEYEISNDIRRVDNPYWCDMFCTLPLLDNHGKSDTATKEDVSFVENDGDKVTFKNYRYNIESTSNLYKCKNSKQYKSLYMTNMAQTYPTGDLNKYYNSDRTFNAVKTAERVDFLFAPRGGNMTLIFSGARLDTYEIKNTGTRMRFNVLMKDLDSGNVYDMGTSFWIFSRDMATDMIGENDGYGYIDDWVQTSTPTTYSGSWRATWSLVRPAKALWSNTPIQKDGKRMSVILSPNLVGEQKRYEKSGAKKRKWCDYYVYENFQCGMDYLVATTVESSSEDTNTYTLNFNAMDWTLTPYNNIKSNSIVTWADLCPHDITQADFFLSWLKMFGLFIVKDKYGKKISIMTRNEYFKNYKIEDWTDKLDVDSNNQIKPILFDKRFQLFSLKENPSGYGKIYKQDNRITAESEGHTVDVSGIEYGSVSVDTNYGFNVDTNKLLDGNLFETSMSSTETVFSIYDYHWNDPEEGKGFIGSYRYEFDPIRKPVSFDWDGNKRKKVDSSFELFFRMTPQTVDEYIITDDTEAQALSGSYMHILSMPDIEYEDIAASIVKSTLMPCFYDVLTLNETPKPVSTLYARPSKVYFKLDENSEGYNIGDVEFLYSQFWRNYIHDLYDENTEIVTMYFRLTPMDVMSFNFYNIIMVNDVMYVVNKIDSFNLTKEALTKVELIRVNDIHNYVDGQNLRYMDRWFRAIDANGNDVMEYTCDGTSIHFFTFYIDSSSNDWELRTDPRFVEWSERKVSSRLREITVRVPINDTSEERTENLRFIQYPPSSSEEIVSVTVKIIQGAGSVTPPATINTKKVYIMFSSEGQMTDRSQVFYNITINGNSHGDSSLMINEMADTTLTVVGESGTHQMMTISDFMFRVPKRYDDDSYYHTFNIYLNGSLVERVSAALNGDYYYVDYGYGMSADVMMLNDDPLYLTISY